MIKTAHPASASRSRRARIVAPEDHDPRPVSDSPVAPHRYTWDREDPTEDTYDAWKKSVPYSKGDVVYLDNGSDTPVKARVLFFFSERNSYGDRITKYRVQTETRDGFWSKNWTYTWPGFIQRGYKKAGLAPEMPD